MANEQILRKVEGILLPVVEQAGLELVDVEYTKEGGRWYLRIFIDKPEGITHEDCCYVSEQIDPLLDEKVPMSQAYTLEVSSPGIERPLKKLADFQRFAGKEAVISTFMAIDGRKKFTGTLKGVREHYIIVEIDNIEQEIALEQIASARLAFTF